MERNKLKLAFKTCYSHVEYQVILFVLTSVLNTFQGYINKILAEKLGVFVIIYFDDILIYIESKSKEDIQAIGWMLNKLQKYLLYTNLKKYYFH